MIKFVIHEVSTGEIRAVVTGKRIFAEANLREGEAIVEHVGRIGSDSHRVDTGLGVVVPK